MIAGVDIGGTKTHLVALDGNGSQRERIVATADWRGREDAAIDASSLINLLTQIADGHPDVVVIGAHGCDTDEDRDKLQSLLAGHVNGTLLVLNDSELLLPAADKRAGVSVIAGTGSIAVSRNENRKMMAAGGWGWFLGDEGSASGLVRDAARAVRFYLDKTERLDPLGEALMEALGINGPVELGRALGERGSAASIGNLAPLVFEAARHGSELASNVIARGGDALASLVEQLVARGARGVDVVAGGGVICGQATLFHAFEAALARRVPEALATLLTEPPVIGALRLARELAAGQRRPALPLPHTAGRQESEDNGRAA
ncbi:BadF/BadG/BcrA/BcrD ATPase family protein [Oryzifoliimicrobium ureilyticus]|uniref:BadF/BadG/BcrA/BcrD ATPase family protein n=1 Tax=Oryzifoliimicrobium ureilyticus TaxID=3113724 RepID=UPI00307605D1